MRSITPIPLGIPIGSSRFDCRVRGDATALAVRVPEVALGRYTIANELLQLL